jgi:hypothetical protein
MWKDYVALMRLDGDHGSCVLKHSELAIEVYCKVNSRHVSRDIKEYRYKSTGAQVELDTG